VTEQDQRTLARGIAGAAGLIAVATLLARVFGFGRTFVFAESVRASGVGQVYASVNALPNVVFEVAAGGVLAAVAVPVIARNLGAGDRERADRGASALLTWALTALVPLAILLGLAASPIAHWLIRSTDPEARRVATLMLRIFAVQVPLYGVGIILTGILHAHRRFLAAAIAPLLSSIVVIGTYLWYGHLAAGRTAPSQVPDSAIAVLAWGTTAGVAALSLPLLLPAVRAGWRYRPTWKFPGGEARRVGQLASAGALALAAQSAAVLATNWLTNAATRDGALPVYQYVQAVYLLPYAVLAVPVATSAFPALAQGAGRAGSDPGAGALSWSLRAVLVLTGLSASVLVTIALPAGAFFTALDARRGTTGSSPAALGAFPPALSSYALGIVGFGVAALLTRALYVRGHPLAAAGVVALGWALAAVPPLLTLDAADGPAAALRTLGLWSSIGMSVTGLGLAWLVRRHWGPDALAGSGRALGGIVVACAVATGTGDLVVRRWPTSGVTDSLVVGAGAALVAVAGFLLVVALADRDTMRAALRRGRARRKDKA
jgi:putative peptidoglycan lipid II flippase